MQFLGDSETPCTLIYRVYYKQVDNVSKLKYSDPDPTKVEFLRKQLGCHPVLARLLVLRNLNTVKDVKEFLHPGFENLSNPFILKDMDKATQRIAKAIENKEKILVFGDFDADGITSTVILTEFLEYCQANVSWYIPHRIKEGYGIQAKHVKMASDQDVDLIITVDCGVSNFNAAEQALLEDIDLIITDHHEPGQKLPCAVAVINPKRLDCPSSLNYLAGVGVAFFLIMALRKCLRDKGFWEDMEEPNLLNRLDLFAVGTIADMVPLININRTFCIAGLNIMRKGARPGLKSLADICKLDISRIDSDDISFRIVPRLNAAGRLSHARICVTHLRETNLVNIEKTASLLDQFNTKRQAIEQAIIINIERQIACDSHLIKDKLIFLHNEHWDPSVLGIVASRLTKKYYCPVILLASPNEYAVGSGRSIERINIHHALMSCESLLERFGGHAMAAGLTVKKENLETLRKKLANHIENTYKPEHFQKSLNIDAILDFKDIDINLAKDIDQLRPFGTENPEPVFLCKNLRVISSYIIGNNHRKIVLGNADSPEHKVEAFHFNIDAKKELPVFFPALAFKLKVNRFRTESVQMIVEDYSN
jgi:single-stranded-DNA-specific exonuclease